MRGSARGEQRKREIVTTALDLAVEKGFAALTLDEVAQVAGASKTTLMRFFGGRRGLIEATLELEMELVFGPLVEASGDLDRFGAAFHDVVFSSRCTALLRYVLGESGSDPALGEAFRGVVLASLAHTLAPATRAVLGAAATEDDVAAATERYLGQLLGLEVLRVLSGATPDPVRLAEQRARASASVLT